MMSINFSKPLHLWGDDGGGIEWTKGKAITRRHRRSLHSRLRRSICFCIETNGTTRTYELDRRYGTICLAFKQRANEQLCNINHGSILGEPIRHRNVIVCSPTSAVADSPMLGLICFGHAGHSDC